MAGSGEEGAYKPRAHHRQRLQAEQRERVEAEAGRGQHCMYAPWIPPNESAHCSPELQTHTGLQQKKKADARAGRGRDQKPRVCPPPRRDSVGQAGEEGIRG